MRDPSWSDYNEGKKTATFQQVEVRKSRFQYHIKDLKTSKDPGCLYSCSILQEIR